MTRVEHYVNTEFSTMGTRVSSQEPPVLTVAAVAAGVAAGMAAASALAGAAAAGYAIASGAEDQLQHG